MSELKVSRTVLYIVEAAKIALVQAGARFSVYDKVLPFEFKWSSGSTGSEKHALVSIENHKVLMTVVPSSLPAELRDTPTIIKATILKIAGNICNPSIEIIGKDYLGISINLFHLMLSSDMQTELLLLRQEAVADTLGSREAYFTMNAMEDCPIVHTFLEASSDVICFTWKVRYNEGSFALNRSLQEVTLLFRNTVYYGPGTSSNDLRSGFFGAIVKSSDRFWPIQERQRSLDIYQTFGKWDNVKTESVYPKIDPAPGSIRVDGLGRVLVDSYIGQQYNIPLLVSARHLLDLPIESTYRVAFNVTVLLTAEEVTFTVTAPDGVAVEFAVLKNDICRAATQVEFNRSHYDYQRRQRL